MIRSSQGVIRGTDGIWGGFCQKRRKTGFYQRGMHSKPRILFHEDITGEEITSKLLQAVQNLPNVEILEQVTMLDMIEEENTCLGILAQDRRRGASGNTGGVYHIRHRRYRRSVSAFYQLSSSHRRRPCHSHAPWGRIRTY